jgi:hypothetical protein
VLRHSHLIAGTHRPGNSETHAHKEIDVNAITRRIAAGTALLAAPVLLALGTAGASHADTIARYNIPTVSAPVQHQAFQHQANATKRVTTDLVRCRHHGPHRNRCR